MLAKPGAVEKFINDPAAVERIRKTFAGQYTLDMVWISFVLCTVAEGG